jgi:hypothetical protein
VYRGYVLLSPKAYVEDYGQGYEGVVAQAIPVTARMGETTSECAVGRCSNYQHFELESESGALGQPYPLRVKLEWATYGGALTETSLVFDAGNVWTEAALASAYREGEPQRCRFLEGSGSWFEATWFPWRHLGSSQAAM